MQILVTGGLGFIGSHMCIQLLKENHRVHIIDNLSNSHLSTRDLIEKISNKKVNFHFGDIGDEKLLHNLFTDLNFELVIHFASMKSISDSIESSEFYYSNNVLGSKNLLEHMLKNNVKNIIFSSSATVYGSPLSCPINEEFPIKPLNPYAANKVEIENDIRKYVKQFEFKAVNLRYFNPAGAHKSGMIGERPKSEATNLFPAILRSITKENGKLQIYGNDFKTKDGTGVRDFIHIDDLVDAHVNSIDYILGKKYNNELIDFNLGTGEGFSVLDVVREFEKVLKKEIKYEFLPRRPGDIDESFTSFELAKNYLNWSSKKTLTEMCEDYIRWALVNKLISK